VKNKSNNIVNSDSQKRRGFPLRSSHTTFVCRLRMALMSAIGESKPDGCIYQTAASADKQTVR